MRILKLLLAIIFPLKLTAQYSKVSATDTIHLINSEVFSFIEKNLDSLNTGNFLIFKEDIKSPIFVNQFRDSLTDKMFKYLVTEHRPFMEYLNRNKIDYSFYSWRTTKRDLIFSTKKNTVKRRLDLTIFPPVRNGDKIFLYVLALSPGYQDDMYGTYFFFTLDSNIQIISFNSNEVFY